MPAVDKEADKENTQTSPRQTENSDILYKRRNGTNSTARPRLHRRASSSQEIQLGQGKLGYDRQVSDGSNGGRRPSISARRSSVTGSTSPRRLSVADGGQSPRRRSSVTEGGKYSPRRRSSASLSPVSPVSPLGKNALGVFIFSTARSKEFTVNEDGLIEGGLEMITAVSLRANEFLSAQDKKKLDEISQCIDVMKEEKRNIQVLRDILIQCLVALKGVERLSKGIPLMRSVRKICVDIEQIIRDKKIFLDNGIKSLKNANLTIGNRMAFDLDKFQDMINEGGQELSFIDAKFLEDLREILGNMLGNLVTTLEILY